MRAAPASAWRQILEAAYRPVDDERTWLLELVDAARRALDVGLGVSVSTVSARPVPQASLGGMLGAGVPGPDGLVHREIAPYAERWSPFWLKLPCGTRTGAGGPELPRPLRDLGIHDTLGVTGCGPDGRGVVLCAWLPRPVRLSGRQAARLAQIAGHLAGAYRLRETMRAVGQARRIEGAEAILDRDLCVVHAEGDARSAQAREALRDAVASMMVARRRLRQARTEEEVDAALHAWRSLVAGRWTLVDHFDRDGRRYFVARSNPARGAPGARARLTRREREVVGLAASGHANKLIGYRLGLSTGAVARYLSDAMLKLEVRSRLELIRLLQGRGRAP